MVNGCCLTSRVALTTNHVPLCTWYSNEIHCDGGGGACGPRARSLVILESKAVLSLPTQGISHCKTSIPCEFLAAWMIIR